MSLVSRGLSLHRTIRNAGRLRTIVSVFAKHGFANLAERLRLGRFIIEKWIPEEGAHTRSVPERIRKSLEELGPTFVKLGQLLASRPDLVPEEWSQEFAKLHDRVLPLPFSEVEKVLEDELGPDFHDLFLEIDQHPLGSASIAQAHRAILKDGRIAVLKVQRPGIIEKIKDDLSVLYMLAELIEEYVPEARTFRPKFVVEEFFDTLRLETNFVVEANNLRRFAENFAGSEDIVIPKVYMDLTSEKILAMELLDGVPLSSDKAFSDPAIDRDAILKKGLKAYLKMVFMDGLFHGDLHAGNFFVFPGSKIGLIDFGVVGRLNRKTQSSIANMLLALSQEDYEKLANEYLDLAPYSETADADALARDLRNLVAPYFGLTLEKVQLGKILMSSAGIAARHQVTVPAELMLYFKSIVGIEGLARKIDPSFDFLSHALEFAGELVKHQYDPQKLSMELMQVLRDSKNLLAGLPRQLQHWLRRNNSPDFAHKIRLEDVDDLRRTMESSTNLLFLGFIISSLLLSSSWIAVHPADVTVLGLPSLAVVGYGLAFLLGTVAFINYIRKP